jgi:hypothetical protein
LLVKPSFNKTVFNVLPRNSSYSVLSIPSKKLILALVEGR